MIDRTNKIVDVVGKVTQNIKEVSSMGSELTKDAEKIGNKTMLLETELESLEYRLNNFKYFEKLC